MASGFVASLFLFVFCLFVCLFVWAAPEHMEVPRLGVESELEPPTYTTATVTQDLIHRNATQHNAGYLTQ